MNKDQKKVNQYPQWFEDLDKWQREDTENRAVLICAIDEENLFGRALGNNISLLAAIIEALNTESDIRTFIKDATKINEDWVTRDLFMKIFARYRSML